MTVATVELAPRMLAYVGILLAVPLSFLLLFRLVDYVELDGITDQQVNARRDWHPPRTDDAESTDERVRCQTCGTKNDPVYTFCRYCQARLGV